MLKRKIKDMYSYNKKKMSEKMKEVNDNSEENFEKKIKRMSEMKTE